MRTRLLSLVFMLTLANPWTRARAEEKGKWEMLEHSDGVTSWKRNTANGIPLLKGEVEIPAGVDLIKRVLLDARHHTKWIHKCIESKELKRLSEDETIAYNRTDSPWPVRDRDVVFKWKRLPDSSDGDVILSFENVRSELQPEVDGVVRVPRMIGSWRLRALGPKRTRVVYHLDTDTGGSVPNWAVKSVLEHIPYETLRNLRNYVVKLSPH